MSIQTLSTELVQTDQNIGQNHLDRINSNTDHLSNKPKQNSVIPAGFWPESSL